MKKRFRLLPVCLVFLLIGCVAFSLAGCGSRKAAPTFDMGSVSDSAERDSGKADAGTAHSKEDDTGDEAPHPDESAPETVVPEGKTESASGAAGESVLLGCWRARDEETGIEILLSLYPDGTGSLLYFDTEENGDDPDTSGWFQRDYFSYSVDGDMLVLTIDPEEWDGVLYLRVKELAEDTLAAAQCYSADADPEDEDPPIVFTRDRERTALILEADAGDSAITGTWTIKGISIDQIIFREDGAFSVMDNGETVAAGTYSLSGDRLILNDQMAGKIDESTVKKLSHWTLIITNPDDPDEYMFFSRNRD